MDPYLSFEVKVNDVKETNLVAELNRQEEIGTFDLQKLAFALIEEASGGKGISKESFEKLIELFKYNDVLESDHFHSLTTAIWSDPETLTKEQYAEFGSRISDIDFECISKMNAYSLCDMIGNSFSKNQAIEILKSLAKQKSLTEAAGYSISEIE